MKTCIFPFVFFILCWYWNRISKLDRKSNLLERNLFALGLSATLLNRNKYSHHNFGLTKLIFHPK